MRHQQLASALMFLCVGRALNLTAGFQCARPTQTKHHRVRFSTSPSTWTHGPDAQTNSVPNNPMFGISSCSGAEDASGQLKTDRATQCQTMSRNVCGAFVRNQFNRLLASDLACPRVLLTPLRISYLPTFPVLNRNTNSICSTRNDTDTAAPPHYILSLGNRRFQRVLMSPTHVEHKHVTETAQSRSATQTHKHCTEPWEKRHLQRFPTRPISSPTVLASSAASRAVV